MSRLRRIFRITRNFLFGLVNKEFFIFMFFLALSAVFWLMMTLNETYEKEVRIPVSVVNVPDNVVMTSDSTDTVKVTLRDKGLVILGYLYGDGLRAVKLNFKSYMRNNTSVVVAASELQRLIYQQLSASTKITGSKPDKLEFFFNHGLCKRVPVKWSGSVVPERLYFISGVEYSPDSVDVYASEQRLDSISVIYTEPLNYSDFRDTLNITCGLQKIRGVKCVPDRIRMSFITDVLTEASMKDVPITGVNMPAGKALRTFPSKVTVNFVAGVSRLRRLRMSDFTVVVDYNDIVAHPSDKCNLRLTSVPDGISRPSLEVKQVDYLIEEE